MSNLEYRKKALEDNKTMMTALKDNPEAVWSFSDFLGKLSKRCRRCYSKIMMDVANSVDLTKFEYYEKNLCKNCLVLAKAKLKILEERK